MIPEAGRAGSLRMRARLPMQLACFCVATILGAVAPRADIAPLPVEEIAPGVFVHTGAHELASASNRGDIANLGFVIGGEGVAVIDTGGSVEVGEALLAALRTRTDLPVRYVINTHMHPDHVFGNAAFTRAGPDGAAPLYVGHRKLPNSLASRAQHYLASNAAALGEALIDKVEIILPDITVDDAMTLDLGSRRLDLMAWPTAHTDNDLTVFDRATRTLFAGDLLFMDHLPVIDGSLLGWLELHDQLEALPADRVVPGHGPAAAVWPAALERQRAYLEGLAGALRVMIAQGVRMDEAVSQVDAPDGDWKLVDDFHQRNATAAFTELEWE